MDLDRAKLALSAAARLHSAFWQTPPLPPASFNSNGRASDDSVEHNDRRAVNGKRPGLAGDGDNGSRASDDRVHAPATTQGNGKPSTTARMTVGFPQGLLANEGNGGDAPAAAAVVGASDSVNLVGAREEVQQRYPLGLHEHGTFWSLEKRDPADLPGLEEEYDNFLQRFRPLLPVGWFEGGGEEGACAEEAALGRRIAARGRELDAAARGFGEAGGGGSVGEVARRRRGRTLVHGDLKTWNVFFKRSTAAAGAGTPAAAVEGRVKFIDWQVRV